MDWIIINKESCVDLLPSPGCKTLQLFEDTHSVSCGLDHISLREHILSKCLKENTHTLISTIINANVKNNYLK